MVQNILRIWWRVQTLMKILKLVSKILKDNRELQKNKNTLRFLLGNLNGFDVRLEVNYDYLPEIEKLILNKVFHLNSEINSFYDSFSFNKVFSGCFKFCNVELSSFFF